MSSKRIKLIMNPNADMGNAWRQASDLRSLVEEYGQADWAGTVYPTHAVQLAEQAAIDGYDLVITLGGDGTVHEVVNGLMRVPADQRPQLGVVPLGSGNDFAFNIGMQSDIQKALLQILTGKVRKLDVARVEDEHGRSEYWINTINVGFGGSVNIYSHSLPIVRGFLMYLTAVILTIIRNYDVLKIQFTTDADSWEQEVMMIAICNGPREGGGFQTAPDAIMDDGLLDYTTVRKVSRAMMFRLIPEFMRGSIHGFNQISMGRMTRMEIQSDKPLYLHTDGEVFAGFANDIRKLSISLMPQSIDVVVPKISP